MVIATVSLCIASLVLLITWLKLNPFLAFLLVSIVAGLAFGIPVERIINSVQKGLGDILGSLSIVICCGAMLGKLVAESGAAQKIASVLMGIAGRKYIRWALLLTGFIVGIPLFYAVGFVLVMPLVFTIAYRYDLPAVTIAIPVLAALSVAQGYLPPHPAPTALIVQLGAGIGKSLLYGVAIAVPAMIIGGPFFSRIVRIKSAVKPGIFEVRTLSEEKLPGACNAFLSALLPVILMLLSVFANWASKNSIFFHKAAVFLGEPSVVILLSLGVATITLGRSMKVKMTQLMNMYADATKEIAMVLLVMGGAGALKQVFVDSNVNRELADSLSTLSIHPLVLAWLISATIRVCLGSATIAGLTTAGIIGPLMARAHMDPNLVVLSIGSGSLMFSHVNDPAFWMFKEYLGLSFKDTVLSWSLMESIIALVGLAGVLTLNYFL
ncbi:MAG: gluconate transporter [Sphingobacteriales bacterium 50-39]|nr:gluconate transporter [Sphingobacteriales bacterium]OJW60817.1 MAG: gluconate transporter [Sphingobacteriales bacterium 50-39]